MSTATEAAPQSTPRTTPDTVPNEPAVPLKLLPRTADSSHPSKAFQIEPSPDGKLVLHAKLSTNRPVLFDIRARVKTTEERIQSKLVDAISTHPAFARLADLRPQYRAGQKALDEAQSRLKAIQARKSELEKCVPPPLNLGARLVGIQSQLDQCVADVAQKQAEHKALAEVYQEAVEALGLVVPDLARQAQRGMLEEMRKEADELVKTFLEEHGSQLLEITFANRLISSVHPISDREIEVLTHRVINSPDPIEDATPVE